MRLFRSFQTNNTIFQQQINVKICPSSIRHWDSNPRPFEENCFYFAFFKKMCAPGTHFEHFFVLNLCKFECHVVKLMVWQHCRIFHPFSWSFQVYGSNTANATKATCRNFKFHWNYNLPNATHLLLSVFNYRPFPTLN